jgi:hypothetical protein
MIMRGIYEQLDWLTKKVKALCCIVENGGGGGCGDCPVTTDGVTITGNGTAADPLVGVPACGDCPIATDATALSGDGTSGNILSVNINAIIETGTFAPIFTGSNCSPIAPNEFYYTKLGYDVVYVWGIYNSNNTSSYWSFTIDNVPYATGNFAQENQAIGFSAWKEYPLIVRAQPGTNQVIVATGGGSGVSGAGLYNVSFMMRIP